MDREQPFMTAEEHELKLRKQLTARPLEYGDDDEATPKRYQYAEYPRMVYHPDGRHRVAKNADEYESAKKGGWLNEPQEKHLDKFQGGTKVKLDPEFQRELKAAESPALNHAPGRAEAKERKPRAPRKAKVAAV